MHRKNPFNSLKRLFTRYLFLWLLLPSLPSLASQDHSRMLVRQKKIPLNEFSQIFWWTALEKGYTDKVEVLLTCYTVDVNEANEQGDYPLHVAAQHNYYQAADLLLTKGAGIDKTNRKGMTALHVAAQYNSKRVVYVLLHRGVDISQQDKGRFQWTALHYAAWKGNYKLVKILLQQKKTLVDHANDEGWSALFVAAHHKSYEAANVLINHGAQLKRTDKKRKTVLHIACNRGSERIVGLLLDVAPYLINATDETGRSPLHYAAWRNKCGCVEMLRKKGADIHAKDNEGWTPLHMAAWNNGSKVIPPLLTHGAKINHADKQGRTPLHVAVRYGSLKTVKVLLDSKADIEATDGEERTPLHVALMYKRNPTAKLLIDLNANLNATQAQGQTPLHMAACTDNKQTACVLIAKGADHTIEDHNGDTPLDLAITHESKAMTSYLRSQLFGLST